MPLITVFTPTYNRALKLHRVFESLLDQHFTDFEWLIVDDGSTDNTKEVVDQFAGQHPFFPIRYHYQENGGKHFAINKGVELALGEWFYIADSDDALVPETLRVFMDAWDQVPAAEKGSYSGIVACCKDQFGNRVSDAVPGNVYDGNWRDLFYKYRFRKEATNINKLTCLKEFPFPTLFKSICIPEAAVWRSMSDKYKIRLIEDELRVYYRENATDSLMSAKRGYRDKALSSFLETNDILNNDLSYFFYAPGYFMKMALIYHAYRPFIEKQVLKQVTLNKNAAIFATPFIIPGLIIHIIFRGKDKDKSKA